MLYLNSDLIQPLSSAFKFSQLSQAPPIVSLSVSFQKKTKPNKTNATKESPSISLSISLSLSLSLRGFFFDFHYPILYHSLTSKTSISSRYSLRNSQIQVSLAHLQAIESLNPDFIAFLHVLRFKSCSSH